MTTICPELLSAKLQRVRNLEQPELAADIHDCPRIVEGLWFIQKKSHSPGGLEKLAEDIRVQSEEAFAIEEMLTAGAPKGGLYTLEEILPIWKKAHRCAHKSQFAGVAGRRWGREFAEWAELNLVEVDTPESLGSGSAAPIELGLREFNYRFFKNQCLDTAREELPDLFARWCDPSQGFHSPWYCPNLWKALFAYMDSHAAAVEGSLAPTHVKKIVFRELAFSMSERVPIQLVGNSRFGKTRSVSALCEMRPGLARLITVPPENTQKDFLLAHAEALHYAPKLSVSLGELDRRIKFIVRHSGLFFVYDESQFLVPSAYTQNTKPARLNWIRSHVIDPPGAAGCAFFSTKQSYKQDLAQFVKKTGFVMEQWLGRMAPIVTLPNDVDREDLIAVARVNFPDIPLPFLKLIAARAMQSEGLLHHIEITAKRARFIAREAGRTAPNLEDVESAIADMLPRGPKPAAARDPSDLTAASAPKRGNTPATPVPGIGGRPANRISDLTSPVLLAD